MAEDPSPAAAGRDVFADKDRMWGIGLVRDPLPVIQAAARECPIRAGTLSGLFGVTGPDNALFGEQGQHTVFGFDTVERVFRDASTYSNSAIEALIGRIIGRTILQMDPPEHTRYRGVIQGAFTKREMDRWESDFVRDIVATVLDELAPHGRGDLAADFAFHYPIKVIAAACGLPVDDIDTFYEQAALLTNVVADERARLEASAALAVLVRELAAQRRADPGDDLISVLCHAELRHPGEDAIHRLDDEEIVAFVRLLVPAGAQTTYRTLSNLLYALLTHPDQLDAVRRHRSLVPAAIEEALRWEPPLVSFPRVVRRDASLAGATLRAGEIVNLCVLSANHDPSRWDDPDRFDVDRKQLPHLSFGSGPHLCLGIHAARMELRVALEAILDRLPNLRLDPDAENVHVEGLTARTATRLPCVWDAPG